MRPSSKSPRPRARATWPRSPVASQIGEPIVDALVERGIPDLTLKLVRNENARLSEMAFVKLVNRAKGDKNLAAGLAERKDMPAELQPFLDLALA